MYGGNGNDLLVGSTANDVLYGEAGNDKLLGFIGSDDLWGDGGSDTFYFTELGATDRILDFERGVDKIDLTSIDANANIAGHQSFTWIGVSSFTGKPGELRSYAAGDGEYVVALDVNGDGAADLLINTGSVNVSNEDMFF
ncbi:MAG TPA: M10 family metallopeptidase C-terminal domain-containing protein [Sphingomicrobium sp.]|jgi:serralysin